MFYFYFFFKKAQLTTDCRKQPFPRELGGVDDMI